MIGFKNNLWQNVFSFFPFFLFSFGFLVFFFPWSFGFVLFGFFCFGFYSWLIFGFVFLHFVKKNKKKKQDLKVLYRDWHSAWSLVTIAICVQRHRMLVSNRLLPKQFEK